MGEPPGRWAQKHGSLLPAGIKSVNGSFQRGDIVYILGPEGGRIACGIANYQSADVARIQGVKSGQHPAYPRVPLR